MDKLPADHTSLKARVCLDCGEFKAPDEFSTHKHPYAKGGVTALPRCKSCMKVWKKEKHFQRSYRISLEDYNNLYKKQNGCCFLCGVSGSGKNKDKLVVDHCHKTGVVRSLLCWPCNIGLGMFKDNIDLIDRVKNYLT